MKKHPEHKTFRDIDNLLSYCELENDFWPNARHFLEHGEAGLAFEGIFIYLLSRDDLWARHHSIVKKIRGRLSKLIDFDELELNVVDDGRYSESKAIFEWRQAIIRGLGESQPTRKFT